jgi:hypothetical protein
MTDLTQEHLLVVQILMLVIQFFALAGLIWYTVVTRGIRKSSQDQVRVSQELIKVAMDQVEGLSKPCLTLYSGLRDGADAILAMGGAVGNTVARGDQGSFVLQNVGNGIALNVSYQFLRVPREEIARQHHRRYVQHILAAQKVTMPEPMTAYGGDWELHIEYLSIGGRKYRSIVTISGPDHTLTALHFARVEK